ncbi:MAG: hypothetical protein GY804_00185, partial [Alphaproteobacteria bacterium]|nr:hypothetical protein [Alphaproteobacteria bacterium]
MKKLILALFMIGFISACNSSSGDSNAVDHTPSTPVVDEKTELEIRFNLPPKPDPKLNNA